MTKDIFLQELRSATAPYHLQLEKNKYAKAIVGTGVTLEDYAAYLIKMYGVVFSFEQKVYPLLADIFDDLDTRLKSKLILEDLASLNIPTEQIPTIEPHDLERFAIDIPSAIGAMYVMEGSTLGNNMLQKHLHKIIGTPIDGKLAYFTAYGDANGQKWKSFIERMWLYIAETNCGKQVIKSAIEGFSLIDEWMKDDQ